MPQDGEKRLSDEGLKPARADFSEAASIDRARESPVRRDTIASLGGPGDLEEDPGLAWSEDRQQVKVRTRTRASVRERPSRPHRRRHAKQRDDRGRNDANEAGR
jgi:catalase